MKVYIVTTGESGEGRRVRGVRLSMAAAFNLGLAYMDHYRQTHALCVWMPELDVPDGWQGWSAGCDLCIIEVHEIGGTTPLELVVEALKSSGVQFTKNEIIDDVLGTDTEIFLGPTGRVSFDSKGNVV